LGDEKTKHDALSIADFLSREQHFFHAFLGLIP